MQRIVKPKNQRVKRALEKRDPKLVENTKTSLMIRGGHTSEKITALLTELHMLRKPHSQMLKRKNIMRPFEDQTSLEFMSQKNDASLFAFGSHSKKRPHNIVFGRMFEYHTLDMIELGVENFKSMHSFKTSKCTTGTKPCLMFTGELFDSDHIHKKLKNLLIDFFRGPVVDAVRLGGMECVLSFTAMDDRILMRSYKVILKKSGSRTPRVELTEIGPSLDMVVRRTRLATQDLFKRASKKPKALKPKKKKNISHDVFKTMHGRVHMEKQDLAKLQIRKVKALKKTKEQTKDGKTQDGQNDVKKRRRSLRTKEQTQDGQSDAKKKRKE